MIMVIFFKYSVKNTEPSSLAKTIRLFFLLRSIFFLNKRLMAVQRQWHDSHTAVMKINRRRGTREKRIMGADHDFLFTEFQSRSCQVQTSVCSIRRKAKSGVM